MLTCTGQADLEDPIISQQSVGSGTIQQVNEKSLSVDISKHERSV